MTGSTPGLDVLARELGNLITFYQDCGVICGLGLLYRELGMV